MSAPEFARFYERSLQSYAEVRSRIDGEPLAEVLQRTRASMEKQWSQGVDTPGQVACTVVDAAGAALGHVWFSVQGEGRGRHVYLWDIEVAPEARGRGVGRGAMLLLEERARALDAVWIELNVFDYNVVARGLYASLGYEPSEPKGRMRKDLGAR
jgi:ribosomal protein S18 acetylase RimI-like enzyme